MKNKDRKLIAGAILFIFGWLTVGINQDSYWWLNGLSLIGNLIMVISGIMLMFKTFK